MNDPRRYVAYSFSVGDIFLDVDSEGAIRSLEGTVQWLGIEHPESIHGESLARLVDKADWDTVRSALALVGSGGRVGPIPVNMGHDPLARKRLLLFLSQFDETGDSIHVVAVAARRVFGEVAAPTELLPDREQFLARIADLVRSGEAEHLLISLMQLPPQASEDERSAFRRRLALLATRGAQVAELGHDRYAILHNPADGEAMAPDAMAEFLGTGHSKGGGVATLEARDLHEDEDAARALIHSIREIADSAERIDLDSLARSYKSRLDSTRERIRTLRAMLENDRFRLAFQPIVRLADRTVSHYEALARFDMRSGAPVELIAFAEGVGLISEFDRVILRKVVRRLRSWCRSGQGGAIAVNLSARTLQALGDEAQLDKLLSIAKRLHRHLIIEVTETAHVPDLDALGDVIAAIRRRGFRVCLDDFGAGLSGFQYLRRLKVDFIKIDGSYVRGAENDREMKAFLHAMVTLCRDLDVTTVGEWVETREQAELLHRLGVEFGQGFYFGAPRMTLDSGGVSVSTVAAKAAG